MSDLDMTLGSYETVTDYAAKLNSLPVLTMDQVASLIGLPGSTLEQQLTKQRQPNYSGPRLRSFRIGRRRFFRKAAVLEWFEALEELETNTA